MIKGAIPVQQSESDSARFMEMSHYQSRTHFSQRTIPHVPNTDRDEIRKSLTIQFNGTPSGPIIAHLFADGTIKTQADIHAQHNERRARNEELSEAEGQFPELG